MPQQILQINFQFNAPASDYEKAAAKLADRFANIPGLEWKLWIVNENKKEAGGIYLFESEEALANYKDSELFKGLQHVSVISGISVKQFDIIHPSSRIKPVPLNGQMVASN